MSNNIAMNPQEIITKSSFLEIGTKKVKNLIESGTGQIMLFLLQNQILSLKKC